VRPSARDLAMVRGVWDSIRLYRDQGVFCVLYSIFGQKYGSTWREHLKYLAYLTLGGCFRSGHLKQRDDD
jgi:hypothetical protein